MSVVVLISSPFPVFMATRSLSQLLHLPAGVLIIWDRMFGTFQPERREEKVVYGLVHPLSSWNPFWAQVRNQGSLQSSFPLRDPRYTTMYTSRGDWCGGRKERASPSNCSSFSKVPAGRQGNHASVFDKIFLRSPSTLSPLSLSLPLSLSPIIYITCCSGFSR